MLLTAGQVNSSTSSGGQQCCCGQPADSNTEAWTAAGSLPLTAKVADFGLALPLPSSDTHATMLARVSGSCRSQGGGVYQRGSEHVHLHGSTCIRAIGCLAGSASSIRIRLRLQACTVQSMVAVRLCLLGICVVDLAASDNLLMLVCLLFCCAGHANAYVARQVQAEGRGFSDWVQGGCIHTFLTWTSVCVYIL